MDALSLSTHLSSIAFKDCLMNAKADRPAFTLVEMLVVIAIIAVLTGLLLPAVQQVRAATAMSKCKNNLRQIGIALHQYHNVNHMFPAGFVSTRPGVAGSTTWCNSGPSNDAQGPPWTVMVLPYLEQTQMYARIDLTKIFDGSDSAAFPNESAIGPMPVYRCPVDERAAQFPRLNSYFGVQGGGSKSDCGNTGCETPLARGMYVTGMLFSGSQIKLTNVPDGTSNVFFVGESRYRKMAAYVTWARSGKTDNCAFADQLAGAQEPLNSQIGFGSFSSRGFSSYHPKGCHFLMVDGSTHFVHDSIDVDTYRQLAQRGDELPSAGFAGY